MKFISNFSTYSWNTARNLGGLVFVFVLLILAPAAVRAQSAVAPATGDGLTTDTAYQFTELGNLVWLQEQTAAGLSIGKYYKLMNDIDASETATWNDSGTSTDTLEGFKPIGYYVSYTDQTSGFSGVFDGGDHAIRGLFINRHAYIGLFGYIGSGAVVKHVKIIDCVVSGYQQVGGLVGRCVRGSIVQCSATGSVTAQQVVGGLVGTSVYGMLSQCYTSCSLTGGPQVGGLLGLNSNGSVLRCHAISDVAGNNNVGGLVGISTGTILECHASGIVMGSDSSYLGIGGLLGFNLGIVSHCDTSCAVIGGNPVGGLVGINLGSISQCHAGGAVKSALHAPLIERGSAGGLVGENYGENASVTQCYATGNVTGTEVPAGGLVGYNDSNGITISQSYATGAVIGNQAVGGLVGLNNSDVPDSYWDTQTTGQATSDGGTSKTTMEMLQQSTFTNWDFANVWGIQGSYPYLRELTTHTLTYASAPFGTVDGGFYELQVVNDGANGVPVRAIPDTGHKLVRWSDGRTDNPRTDTNVTSAVSVAAIFDPPFAPAVQSASLYTLDTTPVWTWSSGGDGGIGTFRYQLDGTADDGWTTTTATVWTPTGALDPGEHILYVQEYNATGVWSAVGGVAVIVEAVNAAGDWRLYR